MASIIYSAPMIRARAAGLKSQTRRIVAFSNSTVLGHRSRELWAKIDLDAPETFRDRGPDPFGSPGYEYLHARTRNPDEHGALYRVRPRWEIGEILWVRETHTITEFRSEFVEPDVVCRLKGCYDADQKEFDICLTAAESRAFEKRIRKKGKVPAIFIYRSLCRYFDEITKIRVERVQDISGRDIQAEGFPYEGQWHDGARVRWYRQLWDSLHGKDAWKKNPWVWILHSKESGAKQ